MNVCAHLWTRRDPTKEIERRLNDMLKSFLKNNGISKVHYERLRASLNSTRPALFYGRPKIHKLDVPLRPIVSCIGTALYNTSKHLADILSSLVGKTNSFVRNWSHFSDIVQQEVIEQIDLMLSFDVKALYTSIPVEEAISSYLQHNSEGEGTAT